MLQRFQEFDAQELDAPFRGPLLSRDALLEFARSLAESHLEPPPKILRGSRALLDEVRSRVAFIESAYQVFSIDAKARRSLPPGAEWILDNHYIVQEHSKSFDRSFSRSFHAALPKITHGPHEGVPRVYVALREILTHTDSNVSADVLAEFMEAYQSPDPLTMAELWAVPLLLRAALINNLGRLTILMLQLRREEEQARAFAAAILENENQTGTSLLLDMAERLKDRPELLTFGAGTLITVLRGKGNRAGLALQWLEERLRELGKDPSEIAVASQRAQAANQLSVQNIITSFRMITSTNWQQWVEGLSVVHRILRSDPSGFYSKCDFKTRDRYRHVTEELARGSGRREDEIAQAAVRLAQQSTESAEPTDECIRGRHVGSYLVGAERRHLEHIIGQRDLLRQVYLFLRRRAFLAYFSGILAITGILVVYALWYARAHGASLAIQLIAGILLVAPAIDLATSIVQWFVTLIVPPTHLPKLELQEGIPDEYRTAVVVHDIVSEREPLQRAIDRLEVRYLANTDKNLVFGLLVDFKDSWQQQEKSDDDLLQFGESAIERLNHRYASLDHPRFFILFRRRGWNEREGVFMGWERKRGKLMEFNELLLSSGTPTSFLPSQTASKALKSIRYVITLDSDTQLPPQSARRLVGTIAHPLNRPRFDPKTRIVVEGFGVIQPRVSVSLLSGSASLFAQIFSGHTGIDPYTLEISDVYQDLFGEASYIGKGIYDVRAFEESLRDRVPDNALLSHDLFESLFARTGLATDVEVFDDVPTKYNSYALRQHRWVRGDWQLLPWLGWNVPRRSGGLYHNPISWLGWWKMFDNMRRSLVAPASFFFLLLSWTLLPGNAWYWSALIIITLLFPVLANVASAFIMPPVGLSVTMYARGLGRDIALHAARAILSLSFLPYQAFLMLHAALITLYRVLISKRRLLEWVTAYHYDQRLGGDLRAFIHHLAPGALLGIAWWGGVIFLAEANSLTVLPFVSLWVASPLLAYVVSQPRRVRRIPLNQPKLRRLLRIAFDTWRYFDDLMKPEYHYLIPDNIQLVPKEVVAPRTSTTNIGMSLLAVISAYDLGFIRKQTAVRKLQLVFESLSGLVRQNGHFYNWYDITTKAPLLPRYISTVDNGNFVGSLIVVRSWLRELETSPDISSQFHDSLVAAIDEARGKKAGISSQIDSDLSRLREMLSAKSIVVEDEALALASRCRSALHGVNEAPVFLTRLLDQYTLRPSDHDSFMEAVPFMQVECDRYIREADFTFLYDDNRKLLTIGFNAENGKHDGSYYDLLASECRLASLIAIAKGDVPVEHWFALSRRLTDALGGKALLSWGGTMFEYLMPLIWTKDLEGTLLSQTYRSVVKTQRIYGERRGIPWGISESGYARVDVEKTYQYHAFGVPGLGLKRGLSDDLVVSPYSTFLALTVEPYEAFKNILEMERRDFRGEYGFYEAVDYTPSRLVGDEEYHIVKSFFAHHQGMSLTQITNFLRNSSLQERFHRDPLIRAVELLLHERFPDKVPAMTPHQAELDLSERDRELRQSATMRVTSPVTRYPLGGLLSNGALSVFVDNAGGGTTALNSDLMVTKWTPDYLSNDEGTFIYVRDMDSNQVWSCGYQPTRVEPERYEARIAPDKIEILREDNGIGIRMAVAVSPEENVEVRKITVTNLSSKRRTLELVSYGEVVLQNLRAERSHPAFHKLFVQSEFHPDRNALVFSRRPRSPKDTFPLLFHLVSARTVWGPTRYETDRMAFLGRWGSVASPGRFSTSSPLKGAVGPVLDPIFSLSFRLEVEPGASEELSFVTGLAGGRDELLPLVDRYSESRAVDRVFESAWSQSRVELQQDYVGPGDVVAFQRLATILLYAMPVLRAESEVILRNRLTQQALWRFGISGDIPIVVVRVNDAGQRDLIVSALRSHAYLRLRRCHFDLVILNEYPGGYLQEFQRDLESLIRSSECGGLIDKSGGVFLRSIHSLSADEIALLESAARVVLRGEHGPFQTQIEYDIAPIERRPPARRRSSAATRSSHQPLSHAPGTPEFYNGLGGFVHGGSAYRLLLAPGIAPPLPWINVVANEEFGFVVSEAGSGYTWSVNSRENKISPWSNDPVRDPPSEVVYARDEDSGEYWSLTPQPTPSRDYYFVTHGRGSTEFVTQAHGIKTEMQLSCSLKDRLKSYYVTVENRDSVNRTVELYFYVQWTLGVHASDSSPFIVTDFDSAARIITAENHYNNEFAGRVSFIGTTSLSDGFTCLESEFLGRHQSKGAPWIFEQALSAKSRSIIAIPGYTGSVKLSGKVGAGDRQCGVLRVRVALDAGASTSLAFFLGDASSREEARQLAQRYRATHIHQRLHDETVASWEDLTTALTVSTPDRAFDIAMNGWLLYQVLSCRMNARTAFFQCGGALGFRDQLQDSLALLYSDPARVRRQILLHASRQFIEGDVQHWWHPPSGRGTRTRFSDDLLWLPYAVARYLQVTGDEAILHEQVPFIEAAPLEPHQQEHYLTPAVSAQTGTVIDHCIRALERARPVGSHGLPLIGCGDWNDGMSEVGKDGRGESVWMAWFLCDILRQFDPLLRAIGDEARAESYREWRGALIKSVEENAWDGAWYTRAYFDDGTPLGSASLSECRIDSLAQSWGVMSGAASDARARQAVDSALSQLVDTQARIIKLLAPPFDTAPLEPGYIKGYLPGIRENGGQYTHAAAWLIIAVSMLGDGDRAWELMRLINPVDVTSSSRGVDLYKGEPFAVAGDVYANTAHRGRVGWSWYTGSAGWLYRAGIEWLLGFSVTKDFCTINPCIPRAWKNLSFTYRRSGILYEFLIENPAGVSRGVKSIHGHEGEVQDKKIVWSRYLSRGPGTKYTFRVILGDR